MANKDKLEYNQVKLLKRDLKKIYLSVLTSTNFLA